MKLRVRCVICGKETAGRLPRGGDGTLYYPRRHDVDGRACEGNFHEGELFDDGQKVAPSRPEIIKPREGTPSAPLPRVLVGHETAAVERQAESFVLSVAGMFEAWLQRNQNPNTQRAYRCDVMDFAEYLGIDWPSGAAQLLQASVADVQGWRDHLVERRAAPNTLNRRISSVSGFYRFMRESAADARLPLVVPNPAHSQFISRERQDPVEPTQALTAGRARQLMALPSGESLLDYRDRAILKFYLYTGARIGTGCRLTVSDFHQDDEDATLRIQEKGRGRSKRAIGIHCVLADALEEYLERAELRSGALFRPRQSSRGEGLADRAMSTSSMYRLLESYLSRLPGAVREVESEDGSKRMQCVYTPHSLRATTATLLLDSGVEIREVQKLLGHKNVTVTQIYDKRRRSTKQSASHQLAL